jgi:hypothetical protein
MKSLHNQARLKTLALGTLALGLMGVVAAGCTHSDNDPNAAPYGAAASPSTAPAAPSDAPVGPPPVAASGAPAAAPSAAINSHADAPVPGASAPSGAVGPMMGAPMMGGGSPTDPLTPTPDLDSKIADAEKSGKKPAIAAAYAERGTFRMNDAKAGARVKYRAALQDYRKALAADPTNAEAKANKDEIESIYKEMGRPIPQ